MRHPAYRVIQSAQHGKDEEHHQEACHAVRDVAAFHVSCSGPPLAYLDSKRKHQHYREHIEPGDHHRVVFLREPLEDRVQHQQHQHAEQTDDYEVQLLIIKVPAAGVIDLQYVLVDVRDPY